ncbi:hypothetical protein POTOM_046490 [Populus tomentosa]|uniref:Uncharacterized protein n=1 Tax=Populus tomentosa TaxID=118781 RepID=A0A8X7YEI8_POPTO|nr:hypothetical protein POTOM_046490 [Populus tomentosa]
MIAKTGTCDNCCDPDSCLKNDLATVITSEYLNQSTYDKGEASSLMALDFENQNLGKEIDISAFGEGVWSNITATPSDFGNQNPSDVVLLEVSPELPAEIEGLSKQEHGPSPSLDQLPVPSQEFEPLLSF